MAFMHVCFTVGPEAAGIGEAVVVAAVVVALLISKRL